MSLIRELEASILAEGAYAKWLTDRRAVDTMWTRGTIVANMGSNSAKLEQLRPVTFHLKADFQSALQYGLIAEEVAKVYPELVIRDATGRIDGLRYDELAPMLLNELKLQEQKFTEQLDAQAAHIRELQAAVLALQRSQQNN